jgi:tetratricopeptide (TPR) repeat protein
MPEGPPVEPPSSARVPPAKPAAPPAKPKPPPPAKPKPPPPAAASKAAAPKPAATPAGDVPDLLGEEPPPTQEGWNDLVDLNKQDDFDIPITKPKPPPAEKAKPADTFPSRPPAARRPVEEDEALIQAREAAAAFVDNQYGRVRHEVTSVRRQWTPVLQNWWRELGPWRRHIWDLTVAALEWVASALMALVPLVARATKKAGQGAASGLTATRKRMKRPKKARPPKPKKEKKPKKAKAEKVEVAPAKVEPAAPKAKPEAPPKPAPQKERPKQTIEEVAESEFEEFAQSFATEDPVLDGFPSSAAAADSTIEEPAGPAPVIDDAWGRPPVPQADAIPWEAELPPVEPAVAKKKRKLPRVAVLPLLRRYWYAPLAIAATVAAVIFGPTVFQAVRGFTLPEVQAPSVPRVTIPRVSLRTPSFIETSVSRIGEMLSGPLLDESGQWVLVADVSVEAPLGPLTVGALTTALELDLQQARFFSVVPRERALVVRRREAGSASESLPVADALMLAQSQGYALVLETRLFRSEATDSATPVDSASIRVFNPAGDTLYGVAAQVEEDPVSTLAGLSRAVRRRLGEPEGDIAASREPLDFLSPSLDAIVAFHEARMYLFRGRYAQAAGAAERAVEADPTFGQAYQVMAQAQALRGWRTAARNALEQAWQFADGTTERERLRILADRHAWDGRREEAAVTYDQIFNLHRDDVGALKAQAIMQRAIGVRGLGSGNLRVAYTIDRYDWPPLDRMARYLGYGNRLPDVDSLIAAIDSGN